MIPVAILCGGLGTRLGDLTTHRPKSLLEIDQAPFIDYQLRLLAIYGIERVILCIGHLGEQIVDYVAAKHYRLRIDYARDGEHQLGTGGALKHAAPMLGQWFGVLYGDTYPTYNLAAVIGSALRWQEPVMAVRTPGQGNVDLKHGWVVDYRPGAGYAYGDAGFSVLDADDLLATPERFDLGDLFTTMAIERVLRGHVVLEDVYEIGSPEGLAEFEAYLR